MPVAHPDEDPASLIVRLAGSHFLRPTELFKLYLGQSSSLLADVGTQSQILEQVDTIAGYGREFLLSLGWQRCAGKTVVFRGVSLPTNWIDEARRVAPGVLAQDGDDPYCRLSWRFPALPFDLESNEVLINRCPSCHRYLTWINVTSVHRCQACSYDLRLATPMFATAHDVEPANRLASALGFVAGTAIRYPYPFDTGDHASSMRLLEWAAWFAGLMSLDLTRHSVVNATRETWPAALELAADLVFRQSRVVGVESYTLEAALKRLPTPEMQKGAMEQLAAILRRPEFQQREWLTLGRRKYFRTPSPRQVRATTIS